MKNIKSISNIASFFVLAAFSATAEPSPKSTTLHEVVHKEVATLSGNAEAPSGPLTLWYRQPARTWDEALPVGNGKLGAMIFGGIVREQLQLNEDSIWEG